MAGVRPFRKQGYLAHRKALGGSGVIGFRFQFSARSHMLRSGSGTVPFYQISDPLSMSNSLECRVFLPLQFLCNLQKRVNHRPDDVQC